MLIGRPCLAFECLRQALSLRGIEIVASPLEQPMSAHAIEYDVFVLFLVHGEPDAQAILGRRMVELHAHTTRTPSVALVEDPNTDAAAISRLGFTSVVLGLPSLPFAVDVVQVLLLGSRLGNEPHSHSVPEEDSERTGFTSENVHFTPRETALLDLLRRGLQNKLIAYQLGISQSTVKAHLRSIMMKLKAKNRTEAICKLTHNIEYR
jgi:DNA-binding NarL/FixJ family response regulator